MRQEEPHRRTVSRVTYAFKLEQPDGTPADPPSIMLGVYLWHPGDEITLGADRSLRVVDVRDQGEDEPMVLVVVDMAERASSAAG